MDQGIAAVWAGVAGLVGAGIGGLATAYGARIGAQKSFEAAGLQVQQQAVAEHAHWVREQHRQACVAFIDGFVAYAETFVRCSGFVAGHTDVPESELDELSDQYNDLLILKGHLQLWGAKSVLQAAETLADKADSARDWIGGWQDTLQSDVRSEIDSYASRATDWASSLGAGRIAFVRASRDALGSPTWEVHFRTDSATESRLRHPMAKHRSKRIQC